MKSFNRREWLNHLRFDKAIELGEIENDRDWSAAYVIALPKRSFPNSEMIKWVDANIIGRSNLIWFYWLEFENEEDAMAFKLRWA